MARQRGSAEDTHRRYRTAVGSRALPLALVDLDAFERNIDAVLEPVRRSGKSLRVATKSVRCVDLLRRIEERGAGCVKGLMGYSPREARALVAQGFRDVLVAYPTARADDAALIATANAGDATVSIVVDAVEHLALLDAAGREAGSVIPVVVDMDMSVELLGVHVGVRRSPLRTTADVVSLAEATARHANLRFHGVMGYEAQIAGLQDEVPGSAWQTRTNQLVKKFSLPRVRARRAEIAAALAARGLACSLFNGGGTGSVHTSSQEEALTELTAGSGFLDSHLFDHYAGLALEPACLFALQVSRRPAPGFVTCHGGGLVASGAAGADRLPVPHLPAGLRLLDREGVGEVQTPLHVPRGVELALGDPVFFRHAKAGELAEHFASYLLLRGDAIVGEVETYRGARLLG